MTKHLSRTLYQGYNSEQNTHRIAYGDMLIHLVNSLDCYMNVQQAGRTLAFRTILDLLRNGEASTETLPKPHTHFLLLLTPYILWYICCKS